jgi:tetrachlorobenzoquinone reductase
MKPDTFTVRVTRVHLEADGVRSYELRREDGRNLPSYDAGSHIDLHLPNGMVRSYSLCGQPGDREKYLIAVSRDEKGRGGSKYIFESIQPGQLIEVGYPRNHFSLDEHASHSVLIAGGIGITPLWSMVQRLVELDRDWTLYYAARSSKSAAFLTDIRSLPSDVKGRVVLSFGDDPTRQYLDLAHIVSQAAAGTDFYCCGPERMIAKFNQATEHLVPTAVHVEHFAGVVEAGVQAGFTVELARSCKVIPVKPGATILEAVEAAGVAVPSSCKEGVCAACETAILSGVPDHRDLVLSKAEKASNKTMMICCSGALSDRLVLDL